MELHVEKQYIEKMKSGNAKQFLMLFDACFNELYLYVARRIPDNFEAERIIRLTFLDALVQTQSTPEDLSYLIWLYGLAKPRAWASIEKSSFPEKRGLIAKKPGKEDLAKQTILEKAEKLFKKLSLEEREILRLKFCEQITDSEVTAVLGVEDSAIGPKIYRVLKRAHFLLFGESDERQGVYFGELSSFMGRVRSARKIEVPEAFKLSLRADLSQKIDQKSMAIDEEQPKQKQSGKQEPRKIEIKIMEEKPSKLFTKPGEKVVAEPFAKSFVAKKSEPNFELSDAPKGGFVKPVEAAKGSNDPAKVFVQAVKEMREEDELKRMEEKIKAEKREALLEVFENWKIVIFGIPVVLFLGVAVFVVVNLVDFEKKIPRNLSYCERAGTEVIFDNNIDTKDQAGLNKNFLNDVCKTYEAETVTLALEGEKIQVEVKEKDGLIKYELSKRDGVWQIVSYEKTSDSNKKRRKV